MISGIHASATIGDGNYFGHGVRIGPGVVVGNDNYFSDNTVVSGNVKIENGNVFGVGTVIGGISNHVLRKHGTSYLTDGDLAEIRVGNSNYFGEFVTIHSPVVECTEIQDNANIGLRVHIAHDSVLEEGVIISPHCCLGGYVRILKGANLGIGVNIHPRIVVGQYSMSGLGSVVLRHIFPGATVAGNPQRYIKPNALGMQRHQLSQNSIRELSLCLEQKQVPLGTLSAETRDIIEHFQRTLTSGRCIRDVSTVPPCVHL